MMPFNGAGTFTRNYSWVADAAAGIDVDATRMDADTNDIASGLSDCVTRDGQSVPTANLPMGGFKLTGLAVGTATTDSACFSQVIGYAPHLCEFRLTLTTGTPVTTSDVTNAATLYFTPYKGNRIALYDGSNWHVYASAEMSIAVPAVTQTHDVFCYDNSGVPTLEVLAWSSQTARATALTTQDGVLVKSGAVTRRYVGTIFSTNLGQTNDSFAKRHVWNYQNRVYRPMRVLESTNSWTYSTPTFRAANGTSANILDFVIGVSEDLVVADVLAVSSNATAGAAGIVSIGLDSTTPVTGVLVPIASNPVSGYFTQMTASAKVFPGIGRHNLWWLEYCSGGTGTFYGTNGTPSTCQSGIHGGLWG
jgi:hypothetical protein